MLVQHPGLPFFTIAAGDYYPSAPSTPQTAHLPTGAFAVLGLAPQNTSSTPNTIVNNGNNHKPTGGVVSQSPSGHFELAPSPHMVTSDLIRQQELKQHLLVSLIDKYPQPPFRQSYPATEKNQNSHNSITSTAMPRQQSHAKVNQDVVVENVTDGLVYQDPLPRPVAAGGKRDATALSGNAAVPNVTGNSSSVAVPVDSGDQPSMRLPPKMKETERMMHVQRWVNHLPIPVSGDPISSPTNGIWCYSVPLPGYSHIDEDRELTPPPSKPYLTRLPFTPEEHQTMLRFFPSSGNSLDPRHHVSSQQQPQQTAAAAGSGLPPYSSGNNQPPQQLSYANQRVLPPTNSGQQAHHHMAISAQRSNHHHQPAATTGSAAVGHQKPVSHRLEQHEAGPSGTRFFAEWETRLISRLFQEYFPGGPDGNVATLQHPISSAVLPSVSEVRARIASSRLKDTRTATAVRAKIKRMLSSGAWVDFQ